MEKPQVIIWKIEGKIIDHDGFLKVLAELVAEARKEDGTLCYWWSLDKTGEWYSDLDCYRDEEAALTHLRNWANYAEKFAQHATIERCVVYGEVPDSIREKLESLAPCYHNYYGGFIKHVPADESIDPQDIIWTLEGHITDTERFHEAVELMTSRSASEEGTLMHWCSVKPLCDEDSMGKIESERRFHIIERYANDAAAMEHIKTWERCGCVFMQSAVVEGFHVHSPISNELSKSIAALYPIQMNWVAGFAR